MNNFDLYQLLHIVANKDVKSNWFKPDYFDLELKVANIRVLRDRLGLPERYQPGTFQAGSGASRVIDSDLIPFQVISEETVTNQLTDISNWYYIDAFYTTNSLFPEIISKQELPTRLNDPVKIATEEYPYAIITEKGLKIWPATITKATVIYYKRPVDPVFKTTVSTTNGELLYDATHSTELEWNDEVKLDVLHLIMQDVGVNIEKADLQALAQKLIEGGK